MTPPRTKPEAWHALDAREAAARLESRPEGLSEAEAERRRARHGPNQLEEAPPESAWRVFFRQFESPLVYILLVAAGLALILGEVIDAAVIGAAVLLNVIIGFFQERKAEASVRALMRLLSPKAQVVRGGAVRELESRELVPGDVVLLESGVRVPADIRLDAVVALAVDESLLTGESSLVSKQREPLDEALPLADRSNMVFTGSIVSTGRGRGYVVATGASTELGAIAETIREERRADTPLQRRMARFAKVIGLGILAACLLNFGIGMLRGYAVNELFLLAVALAVGAIPEGLPVVFTVTMAVGVRRMARRGAIIRHLPAVETLGSTTVIGSDKTGTLTENRMTVTEVWTVGQRVELPRGGPIEASEALRLALTAGVMTNEAELSSGGEARGDPTEVALLAAAQRAGVDYRLLRHRHAPLQERPFEPVLQYSASLRRFGEGTRLFVKGAPERVLAMCGSMLGAGGGMPLDEGAILAANQEMASRGLRVLGLAHAPGPAKALTGEDGPDDLVFLGLVGMVDPPRQGVKEAIAGCQGSGIRVVMITGDHAATARAIGRELGIAPPGARVVSGAELAPLSDEALRDVVQEVSVFARVAPEEKLRIVHALRARGEVVAVTGDGVNDAPALKGSDIGVAMGRSGTDVAREAADMVLTDDDFVSIYAAVSEGRITFENLRKATFFLLSTGAAEILLILTALASGLPSPFVAAQLLWLNLVTNGLQDMALAFEPGEKGILRKPPRPRREGILSALLWERLVVTGFVMAAGSLLLFLWELGQEASLERARTVALTTMVLFQAYHVGNSRSEHLSVLAKSPFSNLFLFFATAAALAIHVGATFFAPTQFVLRLAPITDWQTWLRMVLVAASILVAIDLHKLLRRPPWMSIRAFYGQEEATSVSRRA